MDIAIDREDEAIVRENEVIDREENREESQVVAPNGDKIQPVQDDQIQPRSQFKQKSQVNIVTQDQGDGTVKTQSQMVVVQTQVTHAADKSRKRKNDTDVDVIAGMSGAEQRNMIRMKVLEGLTMEMNLEDTRLNLTKFTRN